MVMKNLKIKFAIVKNYRWDRNIWCEVANIRLQYYLYTVFRKKHPLTLSFISPWMMCGFKQKLQWIYPRKGRFWQCRNYIFILADDVIMTSHLCD